MPSKNDFAGGYKQCSSSTNVPVSPAHSSNCLHTFLWTATAYPCMWCHWNTVWERICARESGTVFQFRTCLLRNSHIKIEYAVMSDRVVLFETLAQMWLQPNLVDKLQATYLIVLFRLSMSTGKIRAWH